MSTDGAAPPPSPTTGGDGLPRVGLIGVGTMGAPIAELLRSRTELVVWDAYAPTRERLVAAGYDVAADLPGVGTATVVLLSLPGPAQVDAVIEALAPALTAGAVVVDLSTVDPGTSRRSTDRLAEHGVAHLDAPVLGRLHRCGHWTLPVGGTEAALASVRPVLELIAGQVRLVGGAGAGTTLKLLNNMMLGTINAITAETVAAAARAGIDPTTYVEVIADSGAASVSPLFREVAPRMAAGRFDEPAFTVDLLVKDNRLALELITATGLRAEVAAAVVALNARGRDAGLGALDTSALIRAVDPDGV